MIVATSAEAAEGPVEVMIRPEKIRLLAKANGSVPEDRERIPGTLERLQYLGHRTEFTVRVGERRLSAWALNESAAAGEPGDNVVLEWPRRAVVVFRGGMK